MSRIQTARSGGMSRARPPSMHSEPTRMLRMDVW